MEKRYGLPVAISMVVGTVIGSGVFFKAQNVLNAAAVGIVSGFAATGVYEAVSQLREQT